MVKHRSACQKILLSAVKNDFPSFFMASLFFLWPDLYNRLIQKRKITMGETNVKLQKKITNKK